MLWQRVISALLAAPLVMFAAYAGGYAWLCLVLAIAILAWLELQQLVQQPVALYRPLGAFLMVVVITLARADTEYAVPAFTFSLLALLAVQLLHYDEQKWPAAALAVSSFFYLAMPLTHLLLLRSAINDWRYLLLALLSTWCYDSLAYFVGKQFGRVRPWTRISPKKSVEGLLGGFVGSGAVAMVLIPRLQPGLERFVWVGVSVLFGIVVGILAHVGDLTESAIKRTYKVKDSGQFLPGHGGLLDRIDSLLFTTVFVYYFVKYFLL